MYVAFFYTFLCWFDSFLFIFLFVIIIICCLSCCWEQIRIRIAFIVMTMSGHKLDIILERERERKNQIIKCGSRFCSNWSSYLGGRPKGSQSSLSFFRFFFFFMFILLLICIFFSSKSFSLIYSIVFTSYLRY